MPVKNNPFSSRYIRPGAIEYRFFNGQSIDALVEQFCRSRHHAGPHGSGKSTCLPAGSSPWFHSVDLGTRCCVFDDSPVELDHGCGHELRPRVEKGLFPSIRWFRISASSRDASPLVMQQWSDKTLLVIDGYEQLGMFDRVKLWQGVRRSNVGLLVTCHFPLFFYPTFDDQR